MISNSDYLDPDRYLDWKGENDYLDIDDMDDYPDDDGEEFSEEGSGLKPY